MSVAVPVLITISGALLGLWWGPKTLALALTIELAILVYRRSEVLDTTSLTVRAACVGLAALAAIAVSTFGLSPATAMGEFWADCAKALAGAELVRFCYNELSFYYVAYLMRHPSIEDFATYIVVDDEE